MKSGRSSLAVLAAAACLLTVSPAFAARAVCTAKDSAARRYVQQTDGLFDFQAKIIASALAKADCQDKSRHPRSCKVIFCKVTK
jgi:anaerobic glycerol-3-phosphate dehydrogenase